MIRLTQNQSECNNSWYGCLVQIILFVLCRFQSVMFCCNLMVVQGKWMSHTLTQGIRTIEYFTKYKSATADKFIPKKRKKQCRMMLRSLWQKQLVIKFKVSSINYPYLAKIFNFFVVKFRLLRKSSNVLLLEVTNTILVLRWKAKDNLRRATNSNFLVIASVNEIRGIRFHIWYF